MTEKRINYSSRSPWEPLRGFSRAVRVGSTLYVSGTTAMKSDGEVVGAGDPYIQTKYVIDTLRHILGNAGFQMRDVVRTRLFVTNLAKWDEYARAHREAFETIRPASSIIQVARLVDPRLLIEMELEAVAGFSEVERVEI